MIDYRIIPATEAHVGELAETMREADKQEVWASSHSTPEQALSRAFAASRDTTAGLADGRVVCMFGVAQPTALSNRAVPWLLGSEELPQHARVFLRKSRVYVERLRQEYDRLENFVDARNTVAIRWLRWLGFDILEAVPFGPDQMPFHPFSWVKQNVRTS